MHAEEELHQFVVAGLAAGAHHFDQLFDQAGELFAWDVVVGPSEVAMAMQDFCDRLFEKFSAAAWMLLFVFVVHWMAPLLQMVLVFPAQAPFFTGAGGASSAHKIL